VPGCGSAWNRPVPSSCVRYATIPRFTSDCTSSASDFDRRAPMGRGTAGPGQTTLAPLQQTLVRLRSEAETIGHRRWRCSRTQVNLPPPLFKSPSHGALVASLMPSIHSATWTRLVQYWGNGRGTTTLGRSFRSRAMASPFWHSFLRGKGEPRGIGKTSEPKIWSRKCKVIGAPISKTSGWAGWTQPNLCQLLSEQSGPAPSRKLSGKFFARTGLRFRLE